MARTIYLNTLPPHPDLPTTGLLITPQSKHPEALTVQELAQKQPLEGWTLLTREQAFHLLVEVGLTLKKPIQVNPSTHSLIEELLQQNIAPHQLRHAVLDSTWVSDLLLCYQQTLLEKHLVHPSQLLWHLTQQCLPEVEVHVQGYSTLTPTELQFLNHLAADNSTIVLPCSKTLLFSNNQKLADSLEKAGWTVETTSPRPIHPPQAILCALTGHDSPLPPPEVQLHPDPEAEVRWVLADISQRATQGIPLEDHMVVVPIEGLYLPALQQVAWEYGLPLQVWIPQKMVDTRIGKWLNLWLALRKEESFEALLSFHTHPFSGSVPPETLKLIRQRRPSTFKKWEPFGLHASLAPWPPQAPHTTYKARFEDMLFDAVSSLQETLPPLELIVLDLLLTRLEEDPHPAEEAMTEKNFLAQLEAQLSQITVEVPEPQEGVRVTQPQYTQGISVPHVYILGFNEGLTPPPVREPHIFDLYTRKHLQREGVPLYTALDFSIQHQQDFWSVCHAATQSLTLTCAVRTGNTPSLPSPFTQMLGLTTRTVSQHLPISEEEHRKSNLADPSRVDPTLARLQAALQAEQEREGSGPPGRFDGHLQTPFPYQDHLFSATQLTRLGQCPFHWYAKHVLRAKKPRETREEMPHYEQGDFYHKVLEYTLTHLKGSPDARAHASVSLEAAFEQAEKDMHMWDRPLWSRQRQEHLQHLQAVISSDSFWPEGMVWDVEWEFKANWLGLNVTGFMDRIDRKDNTYRIWDYKTSGTAPKGVKDEAGKLNVDIQLSLYLEVLSQQVQEANITMEGQYFSLTHMTTLRRATQTSQPHQQFIASLIEHFENGFFPVQPDPERQACSSCGLTSMCRQGQRLERKRRSL